ncbi:MAG: VF530 family protein [Desulfuromonadales bacterium]
MKTNIDGQDFTIVTELSKKNSLDPLQGITLKMILSALVGRYGWEEMGENIEIRCFIHDPSIQSSLKFLRRTPWARDKVEEMYLRWKRDEPD